MAETVRDGRQNQSGGEGKKGSHRGRWSETKLVAVCSLLAAVVSAGMSFTTSYIQREAEYSLEKAKYFHELVGFLTPESEERTKANLALLSLWQLFSRKDERKIIILSAIEVENSDIIRTLTAFSEELKPYQHYLEAAAQSNNERTAKEARRLLNFISYDARLDALVNPILDEEETIANRHLGSVNYKELRQLLIDVPEAASLLIKRYHDRIPTSALLSYALFETGRDTGYFQSLFEKGIQNPDMFRDHFPVVARVLQLPAEIERQLQYWAAAYLDCSLPNPPTCTASPAAQDAAIQVLARAHVSLLTDSDLRTQVMADAESYLALPRIDEQDAIKAFTVVAEWSDDDFALKNLDRAGSLLQTMPRLQDDLVRRLCGKRGQSVGAALRSQLLTVIECHAG